MPDAQIVAAQQYGASKSDLSMLQTFKQRAAEFLGARADLQRLGAHIARTTNDEKTLLEYGALVDRAAFIEEKISQATRAIDASFTAVRRAIGLDGLRALSALGIVWLLPVAIVAGALAVLGYWLSDFAKFKARFSEQQRVAAELVSQGVAPIEANRQAAAIVASAEPQGLAATVGGALKFALIAVAGFYLWQTYKRG